MVIQTLKARIAALKEAMKEKDIPAKVMTTLKESSSELQTLLDKAREAALESGVSEADMGMEAGAMPEEGGPIDPHKIKPGHKMKKTVTVQHDGPAEDEEESDGDEPEPKDAKDEKDDKEGYEESRRVHIESLLKEAGVPKEICTADKLIKMSLKEAKEAIAEKKALIAEARKTVEGELDFVPAGEGQSMHESAGGENLNSLFTGCAE